MIKRIFIFTIAIVLLFFISYFLNKYLVDKNNLTLSFPLFKVYIFQTISALFVYILIELILTVLPNETGYLYLALTMIKIGVFVLIFQDSIFSENPLTKADKASLIIPLFLFLITEVVGVSKLLNNKEYNVTSPTNTNTKN